MLCSLIIFIVGSESNVCEKNIGPKIAHALSVVVSVRSIMAHAVVIVSKSPTSSVCTPRHVEHLAGRLCFLVGLARLDELPVTKEPRQCLCKTNQST